MKNKGKANKNILFSYFLTLLFLLQVIPAVSQKKQLPEEVKIQIDNFKVNAIKNRNVGNDNAAATYLNKIAYLYWEYYFYNEAITSFEEVLTINEDLGNNTGAQKILDNIAFVYSDMERYDKAIEYFNKSLKLLQTKGDIQQIAECMSNLALAYNNNGQYNEAIDYGNQGLELSKNANNIKLVRSFYGTLYQSYDKKGEKEKAMQYFELYSSIDKHLQQQSFDEQQKLSQQKISQVEAEKYQTEQVLSKTKDTLKEVETISREKQLEIDNLNQLKEIQELSIKQHEAKSKSERRLRYFLISIFVSVSILAFMIYRQNQQKKQTNIKLKKLNEEIKKKNDQILASISYASHIQEAILPYQENMREDIPESFVLYKPRDIVSGDFYWHARHDDKVFVAAIDCTGHGVPGAFMSMIGNTLLNEIVNEKKVFNPSEILTQLNRKVIVTLNQDNKEKEGFSEDGMDMTICCYDIKNKELQISLANHSTCIFQGNNINVLEGDIYSIGGNVGISDVTYTTHTIKISEDTTIYMYSDGYQDQFGVQNNQKYLAPRFIDFLQSIQKIPFSKHKDLLEEEYNQWKGSGRQIDDVLIIGMRFQK